MGLVEGFGNMIIDEEQYETNTLSTGSLSSIMLFIIGLRLFMIFIVLMLWPKIMPKLFTNVSATPTYLQLLGLSIIISLL